MASSTSVFDYTDFKAYLAERFSTSGENRGMRIKFSKLVNASPSYMNKVLSGNIKLNLENVPVLNRLLGHTEDESKFFMQMVLYSQAGSKDLEQHFKSEMDAILEARRVSAAWIPNKEEYPEHVQAKFFSHWIYKVTHILTAVPAFQTKTAISERLKLSLSGVTQVLDYLVQIGMVENKNDRFRYNFNAPRLHLKKDSTWATHGHVNLRQFAIHKLTEPRQEDFHYSSVVAISKKDFEIVRNKFQQIVRDLEPMIEESEIEEVYTFSIDLFNV